MTERLDHDALRREVLDDCVKALGKALKPHRDRKVSSLQRLDAERVVEAVTAAFIHKRAEQAARPEVQALSLDNTLLKGL